jgi:hypothetical protein
LGRLAISRPINFCEREGGEASMIYYKVLQPERTQENISLRTHGLLREVKPEMSIITMRLYSLEH